MAIDPVRFRHFLAEAGSLLARSAIAWVASCALYFVFAMPFAWEGAESMIGQPIVAAVFSFVAVPVFAILGIPLYIPRVANGWYRLGWISPLLAGSGVVLLVLSVIPELRESYFDPESQRHYESFNSTLAPAGYGLVMFSIVHCPFLSIRTIGDVWRRLF